MLQGIPVSTTLDRRQGEPDRRRMPRPGSPGRRAADLARAGMVALVVTAAASPAAAQKAELPSGGPIRFGFDATSAQRARSLGLPVTYANVWAGAWNQPEKYGWGGIRTQMKTAKAHGLVPVVHWYYWGDDISPACVEHGCDSRYHGGVHKDRATWYRMSNELADLIVDVAGANSGAILALETEFNKRGIQNYEPFDGYLEDHIEIFHRRGIQVVLGFGNWDTHKWKNFDRAIAAADLLGVMALQSSVRDASTYLSGADMLLSAARYNQTTFGKASFVSDFAFSSYPTPSYELYQDTVIRDIFARIDEFRAAGVTGMVWRMLVDDPKFSLDNYHKVAERHWGIIRADGTPKPAFEPFRAGILAEAGQPQTRRTAPPVVTASRR